MKVRRLSGSCDHVLQPVEQVRKHYPSSSSFFVDAGNVSANDRHEPGLSGGIKNRNHKEAEMTEAFGALVQYPNDKGP